MPATPFRVVLDLYVEKCFDCVKSFAGILHFSSMASIIMNVDGYSSLKAIVCPDTTASMPSAAGPHSPENTPCRNAP